MKRLSWLVSPVVAIQQRPSVFLRAPTTAAHRWANKMGDAYARRLAEVGEEGIAEDLLGCWFTDEEIVEAFARVGPSIEKRRERLAGRYLGTEILSLLDAAHASVKNAPLAILRAPETGLKAPAAYGKMMASRRYRGERRARSLWDALGDICEDVYLPYLKSLWVIAALAKGERPTAPPRFGQLVPELPKRLESNSLVNPSSVRVRNAVQHCFAEYLVEEHAVSLWNALEGRETWREQFSIPELEAFAFDLVGAATALQEAVSYFNEKAMHGAGFFQIFIDLRLAFKARDAGEVGRLATEMETRSRGMFTEIHALHAFGMIDGAT